VHAGVRRVDGERADSRPNSQPLPPGQSPNSGSQDPKIRVDVNLVVLHTTVLDDRGRFADGLKEENFRVLEDKPNKARCL